MTQDELAAKIGVSRWMVNRLETGERTPSFDLAIKIEKLTGSAVTPMDFVKPEHAGAA